MSTGTRFLFVFTLAVAVFVGAVAFAATGEWWVLPVALLVHLAGTVVVLAMLSRALGQQDKPDPLTEAAEAEQVEQDAAPPEGEQRPESEERVFGIPERR